MEFSEFLEKYNSLDMTGIYEKEFVLDYYTQRQRRV